MHQVIIIGAGPAGMTAAIYAARKGLKTLVIGTDVGGQVAKSGEVENYLGVGSTTGAELAVQFHKHIETFENIDHKHGLTVTKLEEKKGYFEVTVGDEIFKSEAVIIATGRKPRHLNIPGEAAFTNKGVSYCDVCDGPLFKGKKVAVIGGGNSAMEAAVSMSVLSPKVFVLSITKKLTGDEALIKKISNIPNIEVLTEVTTREIQGDKFVTGLTYRDVDNAEHRLEVEGVFIEVGYIPNNTFDTITKKNEHHQICIDKNCATSIEGLFAAGDITDIRDNQIIIAAGEGAKAALSAFYYLTKKI